jgi:uncharacterized protein (DUF2252 family)
MADKRKIQRKAREGARFRSRKERIEAGRQLRAKLPRSVHAEWKPPKNRRDPVEILEESNRGRIKELIPIRYGRMLRSPFTFLRGSAALMTYDLASLSRTGIHVQACGDCHLLNFGVFATPERNLVFDINDFDESLPAPWEWDVKRLATSFVIACRDQKFSRTDCEEAAVECVRGYREHLREYSRMSPTEVWYARLDMQSLIEMSPDKETRTRREMFATKARRRVIENVFPQIAGKVGARHRFVDQPPLFYHADTGPDAEKRWLEGFAAYRATLSEERRVLIDRYRFEDFALKVVGIGSVGTRCAVALLVSEEDHPLVLQIKEAGRSVLEPYAKVSQYENQGQRVVVAQRLMQSSSDIFLGWARAPRGHDIYVRQLRDMKFSIPVEGSTPEGFLRYAELCGWSLARAHAKSGDAATISGYLGKSDAFDQAMGSFALAYADQTERDYAALIRAEKSGRIQALREEES